jgi:hypothetical protein
MLLSLLLAGLTGFFVWKKWWGAAVLSAMAWFTFLWLDMLVLLNAMWISQRTGF